MSEANGCIILMTQIMNLLICTFERKGCSMAYIHRRFLQRNDSGYYFSITKLFLSQPKVSHVVIVIKSNCLTLCVLLLGCIIWMMMDSMAILIMKGLPLRRDPN